MYIIETSTCHEPSEWTRLSCIVSNQISSLSGCFMYHSGSLKSQSSRASVPGFCVNDCKSRKKEHKHKHQNNAFCPLSGFYSFLISPSRSTSSLPNGGDVNIEGNQKLPPDRGSIINMSNLPSLNITDIFMFYLPASLCRKSFFVKLHLSTAANIVWCFFLFLFIRSAMVYHGSSRPFSSVSHDFHLFTTLAKAFFYSCAIHIAQKFEKEHHYQKQKTRKTIKNNRLQRQIICYTIN